MKLSLPDPLRGAFSVVALCVVTIASVAAGTLWVQGEKVGGVADTTLPDLIALSQQALVIDQAVSEMATFPNLKTEATVNAHAAALKGIIGYINPENDLSGFHGETLARTRAEAQVAVDTLASLLRERIRTEERLRDRMALLDVLRETLSEATDSLVEVELDITHQEGTRLIQRFGQSQPSTNGDTGGLKSELDAFVAQATERASTTFDIKARTARLLALLTVAGTTDTLETLSPLRTAFEGELRGLTQSTGVMADPPLATENSNLVRELSRSLESLRDLGQGDHSLFSLRAKLIDLRLEVDLRLDANRRFARRMSELSSAIITQAERDYTSLGETLRADLIRDTVILALLTLTVLVCLVLIARMTQRALRSRERSLREAVKRANLANSAKTNFLANMSHELRTPLNAIIGFSEMMAERVFGPMGHPKYGEYVGDIRQSARHLLGLINELLDLARIESGKETLTLEWVPFLDLIEDCLRLTTPLAREKHITLEARAQAANGLSGSTVRVDPLRFRQVLINLIGNAIKYTRDDGHIQIGWRALGDTGLEITITDTGVGMTESQIEVALQPFSKLDEDFRVSSEGTGLGLSIAKAIIREHGGTMAIASAPGQGTTVTLTLPDHLARRAVEAA